MSNDLDVILEVMLGFFVGITLLLVVMVRLEQTLGSTEPTDFRGRRLRSTWRRPRPRSNIPTEAKELPGEPASQRPAQPTRNPDARPVEPDDGDAS